MPLLDLRGPIAGGGESKEEGGGTDHFGVLDSGTSTKRLGSSIGPRRTAGQA